MLIVYLETIPTAAHVSPAILHLSLQPISHPKAFRSSSFSRSEPAASSSSRCVRRSIATELWERCMGKRMYVWRSKQVRPQCRHRFLGAISQTKSPKEFTSLRLSDVQSNDKSPLLFHRVFTAPLSAPASSNARLRPWSSPAPPGHPPGQPPSRSAR